MKIVLAAYIVFMCVLAAFHFCDVCVQVTPSMAIGLYHGTNKMPERGDVVGFCPRDFAFELAQEREYLAPGQCANGLRPLMKYLAAVPHDTIVVSDTNVLCGAGDFHCLWPITAKEFDSKGRPVSGRLKSGTVPANMAVVLTMHEGSYDSRYFGFVPLADLKVYQPLITF